VAVCLPRLLLELPDVGLHITPILQSSQIPRIVQTFLTVPSASCWVMLGHAGSYTHTALCLILVAIFSCQQPIESHKLVRTSALWLLHRLHVFIVAPPPTPCLQECSICLLSCAGLPARDIETVTICASWWPQKHRWLRWRHPAGRAAQDRTWGGPHEHGRQWAVATHLSGPCQEIRCGDV
jgi:hypothetical protein